MRIIGPIGCSRRALTLAECLLAITILPFAVAAVAMAIVAGQSQAVEAMRQTRAAVLAEALMEEVLALPYDDPGGASALGPEAGETARSLFDNADDFHGYADSAGGVADATGTLYPEPMQRFSRSVACALTAVNVPALGGAISGLQVTVTVSDDGDAVTTLTRFIVDPN